jgi:hypothetical protein
MELLGSSMRAYANDRDPPNPHHNLPPSRLPNGPSKTMTELNQKQHAQNPAHACADVKPRLTKEQHDILEAHFQQQHKPSTSTKKGFAESLGVPVDKINVSWRCIPRQIAHDSHNIELVSEPKSKSKAGSEETG